MNIAAPAILNYSSLDRELDKAKSDLFMTKYAAFYGSLLCSLNFTWNTRIPTAATNGIDLFWNPNDFLKCTPGQRKTTLRHEVEHVARLHFDRQGSREPRLWNYATDYRINNDMDYEGYETAGFGLLIDHRYGPGMPEENIYDDLVARQANFPQFIMDMLAEDENGQPLTKEQKAQIVSNVVRAAQQAKLAGAGNMPSDIEKTLDVFLTPVVPWQRHISRFFTELMDEDAYTWSRPNRRYSNLYLPSRYQEEGALAHLCYFEDVSGSISDTDMIRFNSEIRHLKETYKPSKMTLVQFDVGIRSITEYEKDTPFDHVVRKGCGGTHLECVRQYILEKKPTAAIIFSDMDCEPMQPLGFEIPVIWVVVNNPNATVQFGEIIKIR
jgi:predicted metal-dependent peptidase